jgi:hypothetical protein
MAFCLPAAAQSWNPIPEPLRQWAGEIEKLGGSRVLFVRVLHDPRVGAWLFPEDVPQAEILARYLSQPDFSDQLAAAHALTLSYRGQEGGVHFILINMTRAAEFRDLEEGLVGHELGHAWLAASGYAGLRFRSGPQACVATITSDIVQHALVRAETARRGIPYSNYFSKQMEAERPAAGLAGCTRLIQFIHAVDALAGFDAKTWPGLEDYRKRLEAADPALAREAARTAAELAEASLEDREVYAGLLSRLEPRVAALYDGSRPESALSAQPVLTKEK